VAWDVTRAQGAQVALGQQGGQQALVLHLKPDVHRMKMALIKR